ncbi:MBL fold metallo-hydrolase [Paucibacter sp. Y2R2-4]|uniref:MBL fold metallo-hydrolase n=1 Tax=Paucibacter sp. Y2R2-4 TaxID=2893553 RepID=UPI0021E4A78B|nr:MBL fold metallo-hydrolase [Paucibacter sp. Y2R2-4]MCV2349253.1 MBL fold metallo-hydrolase [Paucibacter sp. Y2R2-4]
MHHIPEDFLQPLGEGIYAIDTGFQRPRFDAAYLIVEAGRAAFIDTGTNHAVPRLLAALASLGLTPDCVDWVIPTHVHLDHAGGVGLLMQSLPHAQVLVHPRGLRHMIDPSALFKGALAVYGAEEMQRSYGELQPVPAERAQASFDEQTIHLAGRPLLLIDTPGHARHHHCIWDARSQSWFTGDTFGLSYREFDQDGRAWLLPTSTPVQFEPEALRASVQRLLSYAPQSMLLTHYGRIGHNAEDVQRLATLLLGQVQQMEDLGLALRSASERHTQLKLGLQEIYLQSLRAHGCPLPEQAQLDLLAMDIELNAQGLAVWLDKQPA